jgi:hypothetical protein
MGVFSRVSSRNYGSVITGNYGAVKNSMTGNYGTFFNNKNMHICNLRLCQEIMLASVSHTNELRHVWVTRSSSHSVDFIYSFHKNISMV